MKGPKAWFTTAWLRARSRVRGWFQGVRAWYQRIADVGYAVGEMDLHEGNVGDVAFRAYQGDLGAEDEDSKEVRKKDD